MQTQNRIFDDLARVAGGALGALTGLRDEIELLVRQRLERTLSDMDLVTRDEFDAVKAMAAEARAENERLAARLAELEGRAKATPAKTAKTVTAAATRRRNPRRVAATPKSPAKSPTKPTGGKPSGPPEGGGSTE